MPCEHKITTIELNTIPAKKRIRISCQCQKIQTENATSRSAVIKIEIEALKIMTTEGWLTVRWSRKVQRFSTLSSPILISLILIKIEFSQSQFFCSRLARSVNETLSRGLAWRGRIELQENKDEFIGRKAAPTRDRFIKAENRKYCVTNVIRERERGHAESRKERGNNRLSPVSLRRATRILSLLSVPRPPCVSQSKNVEFHCSLFLL